MAVGKVSRILAALKIRALAEKLSKQISKRVKKSGVMLHCDRLVTDNRKNGRTRPTIKAG